MKKQLQKLLEQCANIAEALIVHADITKSEQVEALVQETVKEFGRIDVFVINLGGEWKHCNLIETDIESVRKTLDAETVWLSLLRFWWWRSLS
jgi:NAD(P)-dependent dehydrogenase (short-subunit alcohol dehydrogenase family)